MSGVTRSRRREVWLVVVLVLVLFLGALISSRVEESGGMTVLFGRGSTYGTGPGGLKALYLVLARSGVTVERWRTPLAGSMLPTGALCLVTPRMAFSELESNALKRWIESGNGLFLVVDAAGEPGEAVAGLFGFGVLDILPPALPDSEAPPAVADGEGDSVGDRDAPSALLSSVEPLSERPEPVRLKPDSAAELAGVGMVPFDAGVRLSVPDGAKVLVADEHGQPVLAEAVYGQGVVTVLAGTHPLTNLGLGQDDAAVLADRLFRRVALDGPVLFDEFHHGFGQGTGLLALLQDHPAGLALAEIMLVLFIFLAARGRAFGRARRSAEVPRREMAEQVRAFARLFRRGRAGGLALELLRRDARAAIAVRLSLSRRIDDRELARRASAHLDLKPERVFAALTSVGPSELDDRRSFVARARVLARISERMRHGTRGRAENQ